MSKEIICADAVEWMKTANVRGAVVTSLPDPEEIGATIAEWSMWFVNAAAMAMSMTAPGAPAVFYQTDRKHGGVLYSKSGLLIEAANKAGHNLLWHKIVLRRRVGATDLHRPGFTHLMAFSKNGKPGKATPDVMERGDMIYPNATGMTPAMFAVRFAGERNKTIIDPFCGRGTIPAVADALGFNAVGVDIDPQQCSKAASLRLGKR